MAGGSANELHELKQKAKAYYKENGVPQKMEEILNSMFFDNPHDVYGHLANYFESFANTSTICKVKGREVLDGKGQPTVQTEVYCTIKNHEKLVVTSVLSSENYQPDHARPEDRDAEEEERHKFVSAALDHINGAFSTSLSGLDPVNQAEGDKIIYDIIDALRKEQEELEAKEREESGEASEGGEAKSPTPRTESAKAGKAKSPKGKKGAPVVVIPDEPREKFYCGCNAICGVSQSLCQAGANMKGVPLYKHIAQLRYPEEPSTFRVPQPMVTILGSGKAAAGKLNGVKEFMVIPKADMPLSEAVANIVKIYNNIAKSLAAKAGDAQGTVRYVNDQGALCPSLDRPEQGLDMIQDAITQLGLNPGQDMFIGLNCAGHEIFDHEKGKYEVIAGQQKDGEGMAEFWAEILGRYPSVVALIDPMRKQEKDGWMRLCERVSERCYVLGDHVYHRPGLLIHEELTDDFKTSGIVLKMENMNTVSHVLEISKKMEEADNQLVMSASLGESNDSTLADIAVGNNCRFLKLGSVCRGERVSKINRLLQIESELQETGKLERWAEFVFPTIRIPTPPPDEEGEGAASEDGRKDSAKAKK